MPWPLPPIIALRGPRCAGKDTIVHALTTVAGYRRIAIATPLLTLAQTL